MSEEPARVDDPEATVSAPQVSLSPQHLWEAAAAIIYPVLRPAGTSGLRLDDVTTPGVGAGNVDTLVDDGPVDLVVAYAMTASGFDVLVNGDHLSAWGVSPGTVRDAAFRNLAAWALEAPWSEEVAERRRVISSDTGDGWDASRILLPDAVEYLERELAGAGSRAIVGLPARHLLIAGSLRAEDPEFGPLFADFVLEYAGDSDESIDRRVFEVRDGRLVLFDAAATA